MDNKFFKGLTLDQLWSCVSVSKTKTQLEVAIEATKQLDSTLKGTN